MMNQQRAERVDRDSENIQVHSIWKTIQGEGPFAGMPAVFVRLAGCNLCCPLCDTDYTSRREELSPWEAVTRVAAVGDRTQLVVLTGGEPFRQNVAPFVFSLLSEGYQVQVETNGTLCPAPFPYDDVVVVCSPKGKSLHPHIAPVIDAFKYVVEVGCVDPVNGLPTGTLGYPHPPARPPLSFPRSSIYIQPLDSGNAEANQANAKLAASLCMQHGYRLCLQTHKIVGLP